MRKIWTEELNQKLVELYGNTTNKELCRIFNVSKDSIKSQAGRLGLKKIIKSRNWTSKEIEDLKKLYPNNDYVFLSSYFDRPINKIYQKAKRLNIKKSKEYIDKVKFIWTERVREAGKELRFKKGQESWNKGTTGYMKSNVTSFKKGNIPKNYKPIGSETIDNKDGYTKVKIDDPNVWELKHRLIWEERFGEIPKNHAVIFVDGNKSNFDLTNLALVHRRELLYFNRWGKYPHDILETQKLIYKLKNIIKINHL